MVIRVPIEIALACGCVALLLMYSLKLKSKELKQTRYELKTLNDRIQDVNSYCARKIADLDKTCDQRLQDTKEKLAVELFNFNFQRELVEEFISSTVSKFPEVANFIAELQTADDEMRARDLETKKRPALKAADELRRVKNEKKDLIRRIKALEWEMLYIRRLLPWLDEIEDSPMEPVSPSDDYVNKDYNADNATGDDIDNAGYWLTPEEYAKLSTVERNQRALDRYNNRHKTNAEIGRDYERYIGYLFEQKGFKVDYTGIKDGLNDLGRDLICTKKYLTYVVQCKCWSNKRGAVIREKHINQIYGTTFKYYLEQRKTLPGAFVFGHNDDNQLAYQVIPVFVSTVPLSDTAAEFVEELGIEFRQKAFDKYPVIKCNVNSKGQKIYHLPFDQMYDQTVISKPGEFYAWTVAEAEKAGFRRAKRWLGK